jgi:hypothetical protein
MIVRPYSAPTRSESDAIAEERRASRLAPYQRFGYTRSKPKTDIGVDGE